jgi:hypothetical protein
VPIVSGFPAQPGVLNPLAGRPYVLLRDDYDTALKKDGITIPAGMTGPKVCSKLLLVFVLVAAKTSR